MLSTSFLLLIHKQENLNANRLCCHLLVMGCDVSCRVAVVGLELDAEALLPADLEPLDAAYELCALSGKHGTYYQLDPSSLLEFA